MKNIKNIALSLLLGLLIFPGVLHAQTKLSLQKAIELGLENNYQLKIADQNVKLAELSNNWGSVGALPSLKFGLNSINRYDQNKRNTIPVTPETKQFTNTVTPNVTLNWLLFNGMGVQINKQKLALLEDFSEGNQSLVVENTLQSIIMAYYNLLLQNEKLDVMKKVKKLSFDRYQIMEEKKELGSVVSFDLLQAKSEYYSDSTNFLLQRMNVLSSSMNLNLLMAENQDVVYKLTDSLLIQFPEYQLESLLLSLKSDNKTLRNQYINHEILKKNVRSAKSNIYPTVALNAGSDYGKSYYNVVDAYKYDGNNFDYYANFSLSFNLFNGGQTKRAIQEAKINETIGMLSISEMELSMSNLLKTQFLLYQNRKQLYQVALVNYELSELNMSLAKERFSRGSINSFNYRDIQLVYLNAAYQKLNALFDVLDTHTELLRITGGIVREYEPETPSE